MAQAWIFGQTENLNAQFPTLENNLPTHKISSLSSMETKYMTIGSEADLLVGKYNVWLGLGSIMVHTVMFMDSHDCPQDCWLK